MKDAGMRIVYDLQACQTDSRDRGIGRYADNLVQEMIGRGAAERIESVIALDAADPLRLIETRNGLRTRRFRAATSVYAYPNADFTDIEPLRADVAALLRERFFEHLQPDVVLLTSFFETGSRFTTGLSRGANAVPCAAIAYDVIPLLYPEKYLPPGQFISDWYPEKCRSFAGLDAFLAISEATRHDLIEHLDIPSEHIHVIGAGLDPGLLAAAQNETWLHEELLQQLHIGDPFVFLVSNGDWRKNALGAVQAFARLPKALRDSHLLVLTQVGDDLREALAHSLSFVARRVRILGRVDDHTLATLYRCCKVFFFPSIYEGFGLPVLEAMAFGAPVLSSNRGSLSEVIHNPAALFDPLDEAATAEALRRALDDGDYQHVLRDGAAEHAWSFTWEKCAAKALAALKLVGVDHAGRARAASAYGSIAVSQADIDLCADFLTDAPVADAQTFENGLRAVARGLGRRVLIDITEILRLDARSGIQRVVRNFCSGLAALAGPDTFECCPIYWTEDGIVHAHDYARSQLGSHSVSPDVLVEAAVNDLLFMLDSSWWMPERFDALSEEVRQLGGEVVRMIYDLIPILLPTSCDTGMAEVFEHWLRHVVPRSDGFVCISEATREDLERFIDRTGVPQPRPWARSVHLGSDLESGQSSPPQDATRLIVERLGRIPFHIAIGTIEPRKDHATILSAFERLWDSGKDVALVIVGKQGWNVEALSSRIRAHAQFARRLFWLDQASDGDIQYLLSNAGALIQASLSEGFGLPIIEAGRFGVALLLSDIAVFHEIAGGQAQYFPAGSAAHLAALIDAGLAAGLQKPDLTLMRASTWQDVSLDLARALIQA